MGRFLCEGSLKQYSPIPSRGTRSRAKLPASVHFVNVVVVVLVLVVVLVVVRVRVRVRDSLG
ncbi:MAG: hypothetical protein L6Q76_17955 [Polyangiaceae bacterium]|nr:hypothetical protein [Polyangiaceae bacterium]